MGKEGRPRQQKRNRYATCGARALHVSSSKILSVPDKGVIIASLSGPVGGNAE